MPSSVLRRRNRRLISVGTTIAVSIALIAALPLFISVGSASESFTVGTASDVEIGQASTTHDVSFEVDLADGETTHVEINTSRLPVGASLATVQGVTSDNADVNAAAVGVTDGVANVSVSDATTGLLSNPDPATITVTLELDTSGVDAESTNVRYDIDEVDVGADPDGSVSFDLVDTIAPTYDAAVTGHLPAGASATNDTVTLNVTETGSGIDASSVATSDFTVDGVAPTAADVATVGGQPVIRLTVGTPLATDATPTVELTGSIDDNASNTLSGAVSRTASDGLVPVISSATYDDSDGDGQVDRIDVTYSEAIAGNYLDGEWSIPTAGTVSIAKDGTGKASSPSVFIDVTGAADATGGPTAPEVRYSGSTIVDASGNSNAARTETVQVNDDAAPVNVSVEATDADGDDQIDRIDVDYSEDVSASSPEMGDYTVGGSDAGSVNISGVSVAGSVVRVTVDAPAGTTSLDLTLDYDATAGSADSVTDGANPATGFTGAPVADTTPPSMIAVTVLDRDEDGAIDAANVTFSEAIDDASVTPGDYTIGGNATGTVDTLGSSDDETIQLRIAMDEDEVEGTDAEDLVYTPGTTIDVAGNALGTVADADLVEIDGADPIISNFSLDAGSGGEVVATFDVTETLDSATVDVTGPDTGTITSFTTAGTTHEGSLSVGQSGQYTGTLTAATDGAGNAATTGQSDTAAVHISSTSRSISKWVLDDVSSRAAVESETGLVEVGARFRGPRASTIDVREIDPPAHAPPGTFVTGVDVAVSAGFEDVPATVMFVVARDRMESLDLDPAELVVYRLDDGAWEPLETRATAGREYVTVAAETRGFSPLVITDGSASWRPASEAPPEPSEDDPSGDDGTNEDDPKRATTNGGSRAGADDTITDDRTESSGMPGFTALAAVAALLALVGAAAGRS